MPYLYITEAVNLSASSIQDMVLFDLAETAKKFVSQTVLIVPKNLFTISQLPSLPIMIIIETTSFTTERTAEVPDTMVINEATGLKEHITDNVAPNPRRWQVAGYISFTQSMVSLGRPTDLLWKTYAMEFMSQTIVNIDDAILAREAVTLKTPEGRLYKVFIESFTSGILDNAVNAFSVQLSFVEFVEYETHMLDVSLIGDTAMTALQSLL